MKDMAEKPKKPTVRPPNRIPGHAGEYHAGVGLYPPKKRREWGYLKKS